jgi:hypothetical protein
MARAPIVALWVGGILQRRSDAYKAKLSIFATLVGLRHTPLSTKLVRTLGTRLSQSGTDGSNPVSSSGESTNHPSSVRSGRRMARSHAGKVREPTRLVATVKCSPPGPTENVQSVAPRIAGSAPRSGRPRHILRKCGNRGCGESCKAAHSMTSSARARIAGGTTRCKLAAEPRRALPRASTDHRSS